MPPTQTLGPHAKKHKNAFFFVAGLSKITKLKNKKLQNNGSFLSNFHVTCKKATTYAQLWKNPKNPQNIFKAPQG